MVERRSIHWRSFLANRRGLKILAVAIAVVTWYGIRRATSYETVVKDVALTTRALDGWSVLERSASDVDIVFSGTLQDLRYLDREDITVDVEPVRLDDKRDLTTIRLTPRHVRYVGGARVVRLEPDTVTVRYDREEDKIVPVVADLLGTPPEGIKVESVICSPSNILIHGPGARLREISEMRTLPIELEGRVRSFTLLRGMASPGEDWTARIEPAEVRVAVHMTEERKSKEIPEVIVRPLAGYPGSSPVLSPDRVVVRFEGDVNLLEKTTPDLVMAIVDTVDVEPGQSVDVPVRISAPAGLRTVGVRPAMVRVTMPIDESR